MKQFLFPDMSKHILITHRHTTKKNKQTILEHLDKCVCAKGAPLGTCMCWQQLLTVRAADMDGYICRQIPGEIPQAVDIYVLCLPTSYWNPQEPHF